MTSAIAWPLVVWHNFSNPITTCLTSSYPNVFAGQKDGHIWIYTLHNDRVRHKLLLTGHKAAIAALCVIKAESKTGDVLSTSDDILISAAEDGEIARWSISDGRCLGVNAKGFLGVPRQLKTFSQFKDRYLFCSGQSNEICILNSATLEVVRIWGSHSSWVMCSDFYDSVAQRGRLVTITMDGKLDIWDFDPSRQAIFKERAAVNQPQLIKETEGAPDIAIDIVSSASFPGLCMAVTRRNVVIFYLHNDRFVPEITLPAEQGTSWTGAEFCGENRLVLYTQDGEYVEYIIRPPEGVRPGAMAEQEAQLYYSARLLQKYRLHAAENAPMPDLYHSTILSNTDQDGQTQLSVVSFCNDADHSTFTINRLSGSETEELEPKSCGLSRFIDVWPLKKGQDPKFGRITATVPVSSNHLAIGYESGSICVVPLSLALLHLSDLSQYVDHRSSVRVFEGAHRGSVTCMIVHESHQHQYLLSGGRDGAVKIWNLIDGKYIVSFTVHALPVKSFIDPAEQSEARIRGCVVSVARDNSVALISVDSMSCLFIFPSHPYPLSAIQWRTAEDYLVLGYSDETSYVWQLATGYLDRVLHGKSSKQVFDDDRWPINQVSASTSKPSNGNKQNVNIRSIASHNQALQTSILFGHVFSFNIRRVVHDLYAKYEKTRGQDLGDFVVPPTPQQSTSFTSYDAVVPDITAFRPDKDDPLDVMSQPEDDESTKKLFKDKRGTDLRKRLELVSAIIAASISWNVSEAFETICSRTLMLQKHSYYENISYGIKGANGYISLLAPLNDEKDAWNISPDMTATRLLSVALLAKAIIFIAGQEAKSSDLIAGYAMALPAAVGNQYCFPSLSLLSKYWQDPSARSLFSSALNGLSEDDILSLISYWENYLPTSSSPESHEPHMMARATIVLGIMGCDQPQVLTTSVRKYAALSLALLLSDSDLDDPKTHHSDPSHASVARTLASMELLSQGFDTWESYINAAEVLRTMFTYSADPQPAMSRGAKNAIFQIANTNMPLVIGTLTYDATHAKRTEDRAQCLRIIGSFIRKKPVLLYSHVHRVVEAVVKTLDPNVPHLRENVLPTATAVLHNLVKTYPFVDFSSSTQKLSVGTLEGASVIYDLRTATRSVVLEGHQGAISALAFSPDAKFVATCSLQDQTVRVWYSTLSLLGVLTSSFSQGLARNESSHDHRESGSQKAYKVFSFALPHGGITEPYQIMHQVSFDWPSSRCVKLHVRDLVMSFNV
ncbi:hypothetical protein BJV82DRAFT_613847 [Fennellomyces sp. T-0311]|nr:hypothetical protein BJV82DRAFT_613847 [Fennellomyces sp. T-0311]